MPKSNEGGLECIITWEGYEDLGLARAVDGDMAETGPVNKERNPESTDVPRFPLFCTGCNGTIKEWDGEAEGCDGDAIILDGRSRTSPMLFSSLANSVPLSSKPFLRPNPESPSKACWCFVRATFEGPSASVLEAVAAAIAMLASAAAWREIALWRALKVRAKNIVRTACDTRTAITAHGVGQG